MQQVVLCSTISGRGLRVCLMTRESANCVGDVMKLLEGRFAFTSKENTTVSGRIVLYLISRRHTSFFTLELSIRLARW